MYLCLNHGESNPKSKKPDSACGTYYSNITSGEVCKFHPGFINHKNNRWTCCDKDGEMLDGCTTASHKSADWPDEEAKLYFFPKPVNNPGLKLIVAGDKKPVSNNISKLLTNCDYFKPIQHGKLWFPIIQLNELLNVSTSVSCVEEKPFDTKAIVAM